MNATMIRPLSDNERQMVVEHLDLVNSVLNHYFSLRLSAPTLVYDDLLQVGRIGLCKAAQTYNGSVLFKTYASKVIRNHLIDYSRSQTMYNKMFLLLDDDNNINMEEVSGDFDAIVTDSDIMNTLSNIKNRYTGTILKGIEALELTAAGNSGSAIANYYGVKQNHVGAWISKAKKALVNDAEFLSTLKQIISYDYNLKDVG